MVTAMHVNVDLRFIPEYLMGGLNDGKRSLGFLGFLGFVLIEVG